MKIAGIILAGGLSRRMGGIDKSLMELEGQSLISYCVDRLRPQVETLAINANGDLSRFAKLGLPVIADKIEGHAGPLAGVHAGMHWAKELGDYSHILTAAADTPFFPVNLSKALAASLPVDQPEAIAMASSNGRVHPVFALWPVSLFEDLDDFLTNQQSRKVLAFTDKFPLFEVTFEQIGDENNADPFFNINKSEDLEKARTLLKGIR